jgi:predicted acylesterase/phospholipase RssA
MAPEARDPMNLEGFTLALGGGGARGYAHLGVAAALAERDLVPARIIGTSMGSVVGAGLAAGLSAEQMTAMAARIDPWRMARRPARLALVDHLPTPYAAATYDLVSGRHELITSGPVADALARSCAISVIFPPIVEGDAVWVDAGVWEPVPISLARRWAPDAPVIGVQVISPKPGWFATPPLAWSLRAGARLFGGTAPDGPRLTARRYTALLAERITSPIEDATADLLIKPDLGHFSWIRFGVVDEPRERGYWAAFEALDGIARALPEPVTA